MEILVDLESSKMLELKCQEEKFAGDERRYYCAKAPHRTILVLRSGLELGNLIGKVVDINIGWDQKGLARFVRAQNTGKRHTKITVYKELPGKNYETTLSTVIMGSPKDHADV